MTNTTTRTSCNYYSPTVDHDQCIAERETAKKATKARSELPFMLCGLSDEEVIQIYDQVSEWYWQRHK